MTCACASGAHGEGPALATAFAAVLPSGCAASRRQSTARTPRFLSVARSSSLISNGPSRSLLRYRERLRRPRASGPPRRPDPRAVGPRRCRRRHRRHHRPGVLSLVATGRQVLDFYAATDTLLDTFGNHEFDYGPDPLRELVDDATATFVSANVRDENGDPFGRDEGVVPWTVRRIDGATIGTSQAA